MKRAIVFLLLLTGTYCHAQKPENTAYADISGDTEKDTYYIMFAAQGQVRGKKLDMRDVPGHSWVVFAHEDNVTRHSSVSVFGYWPDKLQVEAKNPRLKIPEIISRAGQRPFFLPNLIAECAAQNMQTEMRAYFEITRTIILWRFVPGLIKDELDKAMKYDVVSMAVLKVNSEQYKQALETAECYKNTPPDYHLFYSDCVRFQMDVAASMGLEVPKRKWVKAHTWLPVDYMKLFVHSLPYEHIQELSSCKIYRKENGDYFLKPMLFNENTGTE